MKILCADSVDVSSLSPLVEAGHECSIRPELTADTLPEAIPGHDVLVVRSTKVTDAAISAADRLGLIVRAGAGTDNIDQEAASAKGIYVCNVPGRNAIAVAELTMALLLAVDRRVAANDAELKSGAWNKKTYTKADGIYGKNMAIIGLGDIGLAVAERAKAFGLTVGAVRKPDRSAASLSAIRSIGVRLFDTLDELLASADIVSIHVPKSAETIGMVDDVFLSKLRNGAILLNTSRGDIVDEAALLASLDSGRIRAGLDVYANEPSSSDGDFASTLAKHPAVVGTHHIGASTTQAQQSVAEGTVETIEAYCAGAPINCTNLRVEPAGVSNLTIRHLDRVGVLAKIFAVLRTNGINVQQMQNRVFRGGQAAVASINVGSVPNADVLAQLAEVDEVLNLSVSEPS